MKRLAAAILVCLALSPVSVFAKPFLIRAAGVQLELPEYWGVREREGILTRISHMDDNFWGL